MFRALETDGVLNHVLNRIFIRFRDMKDDLFPSGVFYDGRYEWEIIQQNGSFSHLFPTPGNAKVMIRFLHPFS